ncbi:MAG: hypothetical protein JW748_08070 [Anaerolineales bacterium]|nr:hypothetical protein [Anaerolineales bacterium]
MDPLQIIRESIQITFRTKAVWILAFLLYPVMIPALILAGGMGAAASYGMLPAGNNAANSLPLPLQDFSTPEWVLFLVISLIGLTITSLLTWAIQTAMIRAADSAADGKTISIREALRLGKERWLSLLKLAFTFGLVIQAMGILPVLLAILLRENTVWGSAVVAMIQTFLSPVTLVLGILVFLLMMSVAIEDARPRTAFRRVGKLVRSGWWGFLLAYIVQAILALTVAFILAFFIAVVLILFAAAWLSNSTAGTAIAAAICVLASPVGLALLTLAMVFSTVYFTLTYRAAAAEAAGRIPNPSV